MWFNHWYQWIFYQFFFEFVFWQDKSTWLTFTGYFSCFFSNQICFLTGKIQIIELNFVFWQVKSNKFICICVLTGKIQQIDLNFCFDMKIQNQFISICGLTKEINLINIYRLHIKLFQIKFDSKNLENRVEFWVLTGKKSNKFICICFLTRKIHQIDLIFALTWKFK